jgi:hypothetical protein
MHFIPVLSKQNPPPSGEGNRVAVEGALSINTRERVAAFAAFYGGALSVSLCEPPLPEGEDLSSVTSPVGRGFSA